MKKLKVFQHKIEYFFVLKITYFLEKASFLTARKIGKFLGLFIYYFIPVRRKTAVENVRFAIKADEKKAKEIVKDMYKNFTRGIFEFEAMEKITEREIDDILEIKNLDLIRNLMTQKKGIIFCTAHIGNWHLMDYALALKGIPMVHILKEQRNLKVFEHLVKKMKTHGKDILILQRTPKNILRALSEGKIVEFLCDQDSGPEGTFVEFFGREASTASGPAIFHKRLRIPMLLAHDVFINEKHYVNLELYENYDKEIEDIIKDYTKYFENIIIKYPDQYFWLHKRWNTRRIKSNIQH